MKIHSSSLRQFKGMLPLEIPDSLLSEEQAQINHGQTLHRLNERGGVGVQEALWLIRKQKINPHEGEENLRHCRELLSILKQHKQNETTTNSTGTRQDR